MTGRGCGVKLRRLMASLSLGNDVSIGALGVTWSVLGVGHSVGLWRGGGRSLLDPGQDVEQVVGLGSRYDVLFPELPIGSSF